MSGIVAVVALVLFVVVLLLLSVRIVEQYDRGVLFRLGRVVGVRQPGLNLIVPLVDTLRIVSLGVC